MSRATGLVMSMPAHGVSHGEPTEELGDLLVVGRLDHKVPMVRHYDHAANGKRHDFVRFIDDTQEGFVVFRLFEDL